MALPNEEELAVLETFRRNVADCLTESQAEDDMFLLRWLRARDLNLEKAEEMLRNSMKWRNERHLDEPNYCKQVDPYFSTNFPRWIDGMDKEGRPIYTADFGKWDLTSVWRQGKFEGFLEYLIEGYEECHRAKAKCAAMNTPNLARHRSPKELAFSTGPVFSGVKYFTIQAAFKAAQLYEANYPEIVHTVYFINCPSIIQSAMKLLRAVVAPKTMEKIRCFGTDKMVWQEELLKTIDADQLRPQFGGTKDNDYNPFL